MNHIFAVRTVTDCVRQENHNSPRPDVMRICTLRMCSEYGLLAVLTVARRLSSKRTVLKMNLTSMQVSMFQLCFYNSWVRASVPRVIAGTGICK